MSRPIATASESELAALTGIDRRQIGGQLRAAGIEPVRSTKHGHGILNDWPKAQALRALRCSNIAARMAFHNIAADFKSKRVAIELGLDSGEFIERDIAFDSALERLAQLRQAYNAVQGRAAAIRDFNLSDPHPKPDGARFDDAWFALRDAYEMRRLAVAQDSLDFIRQLAQEPFPWAS